MIIVLKVLLLSAIIFFIVPLVFFLVIGLGGRFFAITIDKNSPLAQSNRWWVRAILRKFIA